MSLGSLRTAPIFTPRGVKSDRTELGWQPRCSLTGSEGCSAYPRPAPSSLQRVSSIDGTRWISLSSGGWASSARIGRAQGWVVLVPITERHRIASQSVACEPPWRRVVVSPTSPSSNGGQTLSSPVGRVRGTKSLHTSRLSGFGSGLAFRVLRPGIGCSPNSPRLHRHVTAPGSRSTRRSVRLRSWYRRPRCFPLCGDVTRSPPCATCRPWPSCPAFPCTRGPLCGGPAL